MVLATLARTARSSRDLKLLPRRQGNRKEVLTVAGIVELNYAIQRALTALEANKQWDLRPIFRQNIYAAFGSINSLEGRCRRVHLGCQCVEHVLPVWSRARPNDDWPLQLLQLAVGRCRSTVDRVVAEEETWKAWTWSTNENGDRKVEVPLAAIEVLDAARETVIVAFASDPFNGVELDDTLTDSDLDPYTKDPAVHAAMALAGSVKHPTASDQVRRDYWLWWLQEAVPTAWSQGITILENER